MNPDNNSPKALNSIDEVAKHGMLLTDALYEVLADKGIVSGDRIIERIKKLKSEIKVNARGPN